MRSAQPSRTHLSMAQLLRRMPLTLTFAGIWAAAELGYLALSTQRADRLAAWASTDVARLTNEPLGPLVTSPFVVTDYRLLWLVLGTLGCGLVEVRLGRRRTLLLAAAGHLGGTALSEGIVWWRVRHGRLPDQALHQLDVGVSYVVVALLTAAALTARPLVGRAAAGLALVVIAPSLLEGLTKLDVAAVGHITAFAIAGIICGALIVGDSRRVRARTGNHDQI
jgi:Rhomboid-like protein